MDNQAEGSLYDDEYDYEDEAMTTISGLDVFGESLNLHANFNEISYPIRYISFVLSVLTCALGLVGNALVIWVTGFHMKKHTCKIWFLNLAVADIVFVFCLPLYAVALLTDKWPFGRFLCKVYNYVSTCNMYVSIFIITTLTLDRVLATAKPIWHHKFRSRCICYSTCAVIWIITALSSLPVFFFSDEVIYGKNVQCRLVNVEQSLTTLSIRKRAANYSAGNDTLSTGSILDTLPVLQTSFLTNGILIPALVVGYFIPLFVILISNIIIAKQVKKSKSVKPHRLSCGLCHFHLMGKQLHKKGMKFIIARFEVNLLAFDSKTEIRQDPEQLVRQKQVFVLSSFLPWMKTVLRSDQFVLRYYT
ncbi:chemokine-like receptor 1 [Xenopus laevis]|uniref:Chemokine-like receptor 1 n=1 Tax=Xenopus laevis TaxID=8355 RepID=A0A8J1LXA7_XENLA|nr:chemokine-like receptor 1 [Xenopus laevis]